MFSTKKNTQQKCLIITISEKMMENFFTCEDDDYDSDGFRIGYSESEIRGPKEFKGEIEWFKNNIWKCDPWVFMLETSSLSRK